VEAAVPEDGRSKAEERVGVDAVIATAVAAAAVAVNGAVRFISPDAKFAPGYSSSTERLFEKGAPAD
jgi:hypothetical protein